MHKSGIPTAETFSKDDRHSIEARAVSQITLEKVESNKIAPRIRRTERLGTIKLGMIRSQKRGLRDL